MKHRRYLGQQTSTRKPLTDEQKEKQRRMATAYLVVKFNDGNEFRKWSNEWAQPNKLRNISEAINDLFRVFAKYWEHNTYSAAIFDVRVQKYGSAENKVYQYENGVWKTVKPFGW